jgi:hypothetical protein
MTAHAMCAKPYRTPPELALAQRSGVFRFPVGNYATGFQRLGDLVGEAESLYQ